MARANHANGTHANGIRHVNLALQGGGAHGAFTWGVLDRLLEQDGLDIEGISGTSAGAMNGAVMLSGHVHGGKDGARKALNRFWEGVSAYSPIGLVHRSPFDQVSDNWNTDQSPSVAVYEALFSMVSPYQLNPFNFHPLRPLLQELVDFKAIQTSKHMKLFVSATNVRTGRNRIFDHQNLTCDALIASACLPTMFQSVEIEGDPYWDGGYTGNPALYPLVYSCASRDIAVVQVNPLERPGVPKTAGEIMNRLNEVTFNFSLMAEMRAIAFVQRLIDDDGLQGHIVNKLKRIHVHMIGCEDKMLSLGLSSKYNIDMDFLIYLKELGRECAEEWLHAHWDDLGKRSTIDIRKIFLGEQ